MDSRRTGVALGCVVVILATAGCLGALTGTEPLSFDANETVVSERSLDATEYERVDNVTFNQTRTVAVEGQERQVRVRSHLNRYNRTVDLSELGGDRSAASGNVSDGTAVSTQFAVFATPTASVGGVSANPLASMSTEELLTFFLDQARDGEGVDDRNVTSEANLTLVGNRTVESLGSDRTVSTYRSGGNDSDATAGGALVHVARFEHDGDLIVAVAAHPARLDERDRVGELLSGLEQVENPAYFLPPVSE